MILLKKGRRLPNFKAKKTDPYRTKHDLVDAIGSISLTGFIHDPAWLRHEKLQSPESRKGKTNLAHSLVWAFLVDRYRPIKIFDAEKGEARNQKKFFGAWFTCTYSNLARTLGLSEAQVRKAIIHFRNEGLVGWREAPHARKSDKNEKPFEVWPIPEMVLKVTGRGYIDDVEIGENLQTDNEVCNELAIIKFFGNVIDYNWLGHRLLRNKEGHTDPRLLLVVADLFFLHTPTKNHDLYTHKRLADTKKFDGEKLYKNYKSWSEACGLSDDQLRAAVALLILRGLANVDFRPIIDRAGDPTNNKVIIELVVATIVEITFGTSKVVAEKQETPLRNGSHMTEMAAKSGHRKTGGHSSETGGHSSETGGHSSETGGHSSETGDIHSTDPNLFLVSSSSPHQQQAPTPPSNSQTPPLQNVAVENSIEFERQKTASPHGAELFRRLINYATAENIEISQTAAAQIVAEWPAASMGAAELRRALTNDYASWNLNKPIWAKAVTEFLSQQFPDGESGAARLRWLLSVWAYFPESTAAYHEADGHRYDQARCFRTKFVSGENPPATWLKNRLSQERAERETGELEAAERTALEFWQTLSEAQKRAVRRDVETELATQFPGRYFHYTDPCWKATRRRILNEPETREWLVSVSQATPSQAGEVVTEDELVELEWDAKTEMPRQFNLELYVTPVLQLVKGRPLSRATVDAMREKIAPLEDEEWNQVVEAVLERKAA